MFAGLSSIERAGRLRRASGQTARRLELMGDEADLQALHLVAEHLHLLLVCMRQHICWSWLGDRQQPYVRICSIACIPMAVR